MRMSVRKTIKRGRKLTSQPRLIILLTVIIAVILLPVSVLAEGPDEEPKADPAYSAINPSHRVSDSPWLRLPQELKNWPPIIPPQTREPSEETTDPTGLEVYNIATGNAAQIPSNDATQQPITHGLDSTSPYSGLLHPGMISETVFPPDDRIRIPDTSAFPWRTITKLFITFPDGDQGGCSGAIIGRSDTNSFHVLTAGHCIYSHDHGGWATAVQIIPGLDDTYTPYNYAWGIFIRAYSGWVTDADTRHDWAVVTLDRRVGNFTGWMGRKTTPSSDPLYTSILNTAGYPGDKGSQTMWWDADFGRTADEYNHWYYMDTFGGQSGSPVWWFYSTTSERYIATIHTYGDDGSGSNHGTRLNNEKFDRIITWVNSDSLPTDFPDLIDDGEAFSGFSPSEVVVGSSSFNVFNDVRNIGTSPSGSFCVSYYASTNTIISTSDYFIGTTCGSSLAPFTWRDSDWSGIFPSGIPPGTYWVGWIIDSSSLVSEFDETNNTAYKVAYQLTVRGSAPDILSVSAPTQINLGDWAEIAVQATNQGGAADWQTINISFPSNPSQRELLTTDLNQGAVIYPAGSVAGCNYGGACTLSYVMIEGSESPWAEDAINTLRIRVKPESAHPFTFYVKSVARTGGVYTYDPPSGVTDQQGEYVYAYTINVNAPDLVATSLLGPSTGVIGQQVDVSAVINNQGSSDAGPFRVGYYFSTDSTITTGDTYSGSACVLGGLAVGISLICTGPIGVPTSLVPGTYYLGAIVDDQNQIAEGNEGNNAHTADSGPITITRAVADIDILPPSWDYGIVNVGIVSDKDFIVQNTGTSTLNVSTTSLTGANPDQFSILSGGGSFSLPSGGTRTVTVRFGPTSGGAKSSLLRFTSDDPDENPKDVTLAGTGQLLIPDVTVSPTSLSFGTVLVGEESSSQTVTVRNDGTANLAISLVSISGINADQFLKPSDGCVGQSLTPSQTCTILVSFRPTIAGPAIAQLVINSNDPDENPVTIPLSGTGTVDTTPKTIIKVDGDEQFGTPGSILNPMIIQVNDAQGDPVASVLVTFATDKGTLSRIAAMTDSNGQASTVLTLRLDGIPPDTHSVTATCPVCTTTTSVVFTAKVTGPVDRILAFTAQPIKAAHGLSFGIQPVVGVQLATGDTDTSDNTAVVSLRIKAGTSSVDAILSCDGGLSKTVSSGVVKFRGCAIDTPGDGYILEAISDGLITAETNSFTIYLAGDADHSCRVGVIDFSLVVTHYGKNSSSPDWNDPSNPSSRADLNGDNRVSVVDFSIVVNRFGTECP